MRIRVFVAGIVMLLGFGAVSAQVLPGDPDPGGTVLQRGDNPGAGASVVCNASVPTVPQRDVLAVVIAKQSGPARQMILEVWNLASGRIDFLVLDGFEAMDDRGICFHDVTTGANPGPVTIRPQHPNSSGQAGPVVVRFDGFESEQCAAFETVCGTWCDPEYEPRVSDLVGTKVRTVLSNDLRGQGRMQRCRPSMHRSDQGYDVPCETGDLVALVYQTYPRLRRPESLESD